MEEIEKTEIIETKKVNRKTNYLIAIIMMVYMFILVVQSNFNEIYLIKRIENVKKENIYMVKSILKIVVFLLGMVFFCCIKDILEKCRYKKLKSKSIKEFLNIFSFFKIKKRLNTKQNNMVGILYKILLISIPLIAFLSVICIKVLDKAGIVDFNSIIGGLKNKGVGINNAIYVFTYICIINALLEEIFFRGFAYLKLSEFIDERIANVFSAIIFGIYHFAIIFGIIDIYLTIMVIMLLVLVGYIFNLLDKFTKNIYPSLIVHILANLSINIVAGLMLFRIIV